MSEETTPRPIRVLLIAPSFEILGGQSVQASRLMECLGRDPSLRMAFQPINPHLPDSAYKLNLPKGVKKRQLTGNG